MVTDKAAAHKLVMRHVTPGTLFSTGMRFYQVRDSLQAGNAITLQKVNNGKKQNGTHEHYHARETDFF